VRGVGSPTKYRGDGYEFVELREYVSGDDPRRIDWAATARSGALQTRVVLEDVALTLAAIVDDSASMRVGRRRELRHAANEALRAWYGAALSDDRCIRVHADRVIAPPFRGPRAASACMTIVRSDFSLPAALRTARAALQRGTALLVIADCYDLGDHWGGLLASLGARCDCTLLLARDPWHDGLPLRGFVRVRDVESGATRSLYVGAGERERYAEAVARRESLLTERFALAGWRVSALDEGDGAASLASAFGLRSIERGA
jgi:uncharacterized protein (DUF58 family)